MSTGIEWLIDAIDCDAARLRDGDLLRATADAIIAALKLHVVGSPLWHQFPDPGGWTGMYLLSESHLTCHTFPEARQATWNLYCCRPRPVWDWELELSRRLEARRVVVRPVPRGVSQSPAVEPALADLVAKHLLTGVGPS